MNFVTAPEQPMCGCDAGFDVTQAAALFSKDLQNGENLGTMLNPVNVKWFIDAVVEGGIPASDIMTRFGFDSESQIECMFIYLQQ